MTRLYNNFKKDLPKLDGKVFVITGTTSGTGFVAARTVAELGGEVVLLNRPSSRATDSLKKLQIAVPTAKFVPIECDLPQGHRPFPASSQSGRRVGRGPGSSPGRGRPYSEGVLRASSGARPKTASATRTASRAVSEAFGST